MFPIGKFWTKDNDDDDALVGQGMYCRILSHYQELGAKDHKPKNLEVLPNKGRNTLTEFW